VIERLTVDVAIVGGGTAGCSAALQLRRHGLSVCVLEKGLVGSQASGVNFGGVRQQGRALIELPLSRRARQMWSDLPQLIGIDGEFVAGGHLRLGRSDADMAVIEQHCRDAAGYGANFELLGRNAVMARFPWLGAIVLGGSFSAEDGQANPRLVSPAFADAARRAGAEIQEGVEIVAGTSEPGAFRLTARHGTEQSRELTPPSHRFEPSLHVTEGILHDVLDHVELFVVFVSVIHHALEMHLALPLVTGGSNRIELRHCARVNLRQSRETIRNAEKRIFCAGDAAAAAAAAARQPK